MSITEFFKPFAATIAVLVEAAAALIIVAGAIEAFVGVFRYFIARQSGLGVRKSIWLRFGMWLLLGLEFELAADVIRTAISPTWTDLGQLATIAVIRTFLNYFLEKDIEKYNEKQGSHVIGTRKAA